jgi:hypothetical protein
MKILPKTTTLLAGAALMLVASGPLRAKAV